MDRASGAGFAEAPTGFVAATPVLAAPVLAAPELAAPVLAAPVLAEGPRFRVRSLRLAPGEMTALQSHLHRSEHWVVVEGTAEVTTGIRSRLLCEGEAVLIPLGQPHRIENPGRLPVTLIAVETGHYLGDDDEVRHEQDLVAPFGRSSVPSEEPRAEVKKGQTPAANPLIFRA